jgi:integrase
MNERHQHEFIREGNYLICLKCKIKKLNLEEKEEGILLGKRDDGKYYSVRKHRKSWIMPDIWKKFYENLPTKKSKLTASILIQTGARINEARYIELRDIDFDRNILRLRVTKTKARKIGEERGVPRTLPMNSKYIKELKKHFVGLPEGSKIGILSTCAFNIAMKKTLKEIGIEDYYMFSAHNIRKTHGNWLKILGNFGMMKIDSSEICLRLGHDINTFLKDYGSSSVMNTSDLLIAKEILGDLYSNKEF